MARDSCLFSVVHKGLSAFRTTAVNTKRAWRIALKATCHAPNSYIRLALCPEAGAMY